MLAEFIDAGGPDTLFAAVKKPEGEQRIAVEKLILCLTEEYLMAENFAKTVCTTYFAVISGKTAAPQPVQTPPPAVKAAPVSKPAPAPVEKPTKQPKLEYDPNLFEITPDGTLVRYLGQGDKVTIPEGVKRIGENAFHARFLTSIVFPESLTHIDGGAFAHGLNIMDRLELPSGLTHIGKFAFTNCYIKEAIFPKSMEFMDQGAFLCCRNLREVTIPGSLKTVPHSAFYGCEMLERVIIQLGVETLEAHSFGGCPNLQSVTVPSSLKHIDPNAFQASGFPVQKTPESVQIIFSEPDKDLGPERFKRVKNIRLPVSNPVPRKIEYDPNLFEITPDGTLVRYLGEMRKNIVIPDGVKRIGKRAFQYANLKHITFPKTLTHIDEDAFAFGVSIVDRLELPEGLTHIGNHAFSGCKFEHLHLPASLVHMDEYAFISCPLLKEVTIPGSLKAVPNGAFCLCMGLKRVIIQPGVEKLGYSSFGNCDKLESVTVPASLTEINPEAFTVITARQPEDPAAVQIIFSEPWKDPGPERFKDVKDIRF